MNVLLTGATGFIGSHVARALLESGNEVRAVVRSGSDRRRIEDIQSSLSFAEADLFDEEADLATIAKGTDACIHAAWYAEPGKYYHSKKNIDCVTGSLRLLEALAGAGCRRAVFIGTCFEYDFESGYLPEDARLDPDTLYAASKSSTAFLGAQLAKQLDVPFTWARLFYQYGPHEDERRLIPYVIRTLLDGNPAEVTTGRQVRDFMHVADVAAALVHVMESDLDGVVNIGSGEPVTVREIVSTIAGILEKEDLVRFGARPDNPTDPPFICANNERLRSTGWTPSYRLRDGLEETIAWWRESAVLQ